MIPWEDDRCIICLECGGLSVAHVIQQALGGWLAVENVCTRCNSELGSRIEGRSREDPIIRLNAERLRDEIPRLAKGVRHRQGSFAVQDGRALPFLHRGDKIVPDERPTPTRWTFDSDEHDPARIRSFLRGDMEPGRLSEDELEAGLVAYEKAEQGERVRFGRCASVFRGAIGGDVELTPVLSGPLMDPRVVLASAYLFASLAVGAAIYASAFDVVRAALRPEGDGEVVEASGWLVERLSPPQDTPAAAHALRIGRTRPLRVDVCFFGTDFWHVTFLQVALREGFACSIDFDLARGELYRVADD